MKLFSRKPGDKQPEIAPPGGQPEAEQQPKKSKRKSPGLIMLKVALIASLAAALVILGTGVFAYLKFDDQVARQQQLKVAARGEQIASHLAGRLSQLTGQVVAIANDPAIVRTARQGEAGSEQLAQRLAALTSFFPDVLRVRIVKPDETEPDTTTTPSLSYACLELVRQAEKGGKPQVEVHKFSTPDQHIDLVGLIRDQEAIIGSLIVSLNVTVVADWIKPLLTQGGLVELRQKSGNLLLNTQGEPGLKGSSPGHVAQVKGTAWELHYWQSMERGVTETDRMGLILLILVAMVLVAVVVIASGVVADRLLKQDLLALMTLVIEVVRERPPRPVAVRLAEVRKAVMALEQAYRAKNGMPMGDGSESEFDKSLLSEMEDVPNGGMGEDLPPLDPSFIGDAGITVEESEVQERRVEDD